MHHDQRTLDDPALNPAAFRRTAFAFAVAGAVATSVLDVPAPAFARAAPEIFADLAENVIDAVVNISAATTVTEQRILQTPQLPPGSPFQDFFEDFLTSGPNGRRR